MPFSIPPSFPMTLPRACLLPVVLLLAACQIEAPDAAPEDPAASCAAPQLQQFVGQPLARVSALSLPPGTRIIAPDTAVTMDYRPERLNIEHDATEVVTRVYCG